MIGKKCARSYCSDFRVGPREGDRWCVKHTRFLSMRIGAGKRGLAVPSWEELETLIPSTMECPVCRRKMNWIQSDGASTQLTLQHNHDGSFAFLCLACNVRHSDIPNDGIYTIPAEHKHCPGCRTVKPFSDFSVDRWRPRGIKSRCRECCKRFYDDHREYWQQWGRARRRTGIAS